MIRLLLLAPALACALEMDPIPNFRDSDKQQHFVAGAIAAGITDAGLSLGAPILPEWTQRPWARRLAPIAGALIVGTLKEIYDDRYSGTADVADAVATGLGGIGYSLVFSWRF